jgi:hypothetical protein
VGIGNTTLPQATLDVEGAMRAGTVQAPSIQALSFTLNGAPFVSSPWLPSTADPTTLTFQTVATGTLSAPAYAGLPVASAAQLGVVEASTGLHASVGAVSVALPFFSAVMTGVQGATFTYQTLANQGMDTDANGYITVVASGYYLCTVGGIPSAGDTVTVFSPRDAYTKGTVVLLVLQGEPIWVESVMGVLGTGQTLTVQWLSPA